jgi:hypothetical protein
MPNGRYKGHQEAILVSRKMPARSNKTIPKIPVTVFVKYSKAKMAAITILMILSADPIFFFIIV